MILNSTEKIQTHLEEIHGIFVSPVTEEESKRVHESFHNIVESRAI